MALRPFQIDVAESVLGDLKERLAKTRWPSEVPDSSWTYGTNLAYLRELVSYWTTDFDWRAAEARLNSWPQFTADIDGLTLHFAHVRGKGTNRLPLLLIHGWPGSFFEFTQIAGLLADPAAHGFAEDQAFDLVIPSVPGFGFSTDPHRPGVTSPVIADALTRLMTEELGYRRFGSQGGDIGSMITTQLALRHPDKLIGIHINFPGIFRPNLGDGAAPLTDEEQEYMKTSAAWSEENTGYAHIHGTRPQTLAYGLTDSPAGLAGWIVEKFRAWSDCGGDIESRFSKDELLTNLTIYWVGGCIGSSMRLYYEGRHNPIPPTPADGVAVPVGYAQFKEPPAWRPPRLWLERIFNIRQWTEMPRGGHFAALEEPKLLADDIRAFFDPLRIGERYE
jgi:pimeloyl-ACP methyl ester carboxylesterase